MAAQARSPCAQEDPFLENEEELFYGAESGWVEARTSCDHLASLSSNLDHIPTLDTACNRCQHPNKNWLCLHCKVVLCGRYVNKHMLQHYERTNHCLALSYSDLSVWCYSCHAYLDAQLIAQLRPVYESAYMLKFGKAPPARTSCNHLASLSSDLAHIPTPDTACNRCQHPNKNWLCLRCKVVLCGRYVNKHMLQHYERTNHCLALNYSDLSVWCYSCHAYLDAQLIAQLWPVYETAYILKFGQAPPARTSCDHLASLSSDLAHIPTPDTACNRCQHPNKNWLCLRCKVVLCGRYVNKHMLQHYERTNHCLALSYSDLSIWCYSCHAYLDAQLITQLRPVYETTYILKFGKAPPALTSCDHLASLSSDLAHIPTPDTACNRCQHPSKNWLCLRCKVVLCGRYVNKHMLQHYERTNHCLALSYSDLSVWCYSCHAYLDAQLIAQLRPVYESAYILKFGKAPPARTSCDHLASLSSDLAHIPTPDTACNRCQHPNKNWLCLHCKVVLCGRYVNKHMLQHHERTNHCLALSYSDLSVWCYSCHSYLDAQLIAQLRPVYESAYILKFGKAPPARTSCDHLASLSTDLAHIPTPFTACNRPHHSEHRTITLLPCRLISLTFPLLILLATDASTPMRTGYVCAVTCKDVLCSRYLNKHMLQHYQRANHCLAISYRCSTDPITAGCI
ncbi:uncharacterized protein LOC103939385 isoform X2 [Pyrus x bretschneideri]|uniref:uncharacterized protein LOC103939385 isoform X2 n=1 Tax=Pyrus x bretschneideri TaxID=225117 RepID=UPI00202EF1A7|nr:uncharacterized protein LOC103939385 isoform X2 [Pyrus x bretschneideri]